LGTLIAGKKRSTTGSIANGSFGPDENLKVPAATRAIDGKF